MKTNTAAGARPVSSKQQEGTSYQWYHALCPKEEGLWLCVHRGHGSREEALHLWPYRYYDQLGRVLDVYCLVLYSTQSLKITVSA